MPICRYRRNLRRTSRPISAKPLRGAAVLAREFVVDLANIDILAAIASRSRTNTASRPGHAMNVNRP